MVLTANFKKILAMGALLILGFISISNASETVKGAEKDYEAFKQELSVKMETLDKEIAILKEKVKNKSSALKEETLQELENSRAELNTKIQKLESSSKSQWKQAKKSLSDSFASLNAKIQKALKD